jgi:hypothetical protein
VNCVGGGERRRAEASGGVRIRLDYRSALRGKPGTRGGTDVTSWQKLVGNSRRRRLLYRTHRNEIFDFLTVQKMKNGHHLSEKKAKHKIPIVELPTTS